jgi:hypothetical protein
LIVVSTGAEETSVFLSSNELSESLTLERASTGTSSISVDTVSLSPSGVFSGSNALDDPKAKGGGLSSGTIGGIIGGLIALIAVITGAIVFFIVRTRKSTGSHEMSASADTQVSCTETTDHWDEDEGFGHETINPEIETFQDEDFFVAATSDEAAA